MDEIFRKEKGWYLPKWENDAIWKKQHSKELMYDGKENMNFKNRFPTFEKFRDDCFAKAKIRAICESGLGGDVQNAEEKKNEIMLNNYYS